MLYIIEMNTLFCWFVFDILKEHKPEAFKELEREFDRIVKDCSIPFRYFDNVTDRPFESAGSDYNRPKSFSKPLGKEVANPPVGPITPVDSSKKT